MTDVTVATVQMRCGSDARDNLHRAEAWLREAAAAGAHVILLPELFASEYFCKRQDPRYFELAAPLDGHPVLQTLCPLAAELEVVLPVSLFERDGQCFYNSVAIVDADGSVLGSYRKAHIPDGPGYQEKFYFTPGRQPFPVWQTRYLKLGVAICWDQWFPEAARIMALQGAELLCYPTAIGSEPEEPEIDSRPHWQTVMCGHAGANMTPLMAANRIGKETDGGISIDFYGHSFIADWQGQKISAAGADEEGVLYAQLDLPALRELRAGWGLFRDRRPDLYDRILQH
jgi:N-carbamoylputrescine amidase